MRLTIATDFPQVQQALRQYREDVSRTALASALNKTMAQARTAMSREIRQEFVLGKQAVDQGLHIKRAYANGATVVLEAELFAATGKKGRSINVIHFAARKTATGVSLKIKRTGPRKTLPGALIANKGRTVFTRVPGTRMASRSKGKQGPHVERIRAVQTIDVQQMFNTRRINAKVVQFLQARFPEILDHELAWAQQRFNR